MYILDLINSPEYKNNICLKSGNTYLSYKELHEHINHIAYKNTSKKYHRH